VDHYLGKVGMRAIIDFRRSNSALLSQLRFPSLRSQSAPNDHCEIHSPSSLGAAPAVEVMMKEKEHTGGRSVYYDQFGIIRDVMQNHLTQALVYSLMSLNQPLSTQGVSETFGHSPRLAPPLFSSLD
jgi:hexose-6-phosphate dehydrogenase